MSQASRSPLCSNRKLGDSGRKGRETSWSNAVKPLNPSSQGQRSSVPSNSLQEQHQLNIIQQESYSLLHNDTLWSSVCPVLRFTSTGEFVRAEELVVLSISTYLKAQLSTGRTAAWFLWLLPCVQCCKADNKMQLVKDTWSMVRPMVEKKHKRNVSDAPENNESLVGRFPQWG